MAKVSFLLFLFFFPLLFFLVFFHISARRHSSGHVPARAAITARDVFDCHEPLANTLLGSINDVFPNSSSRIRSVCLSAKRYPKAWTCAPVPPRRPVWARDSTSSPEPSVHPPLVKLGWTLFWPFLLQIEHRNLLHAMTIWSWLISLIQVLGVDRVGLERVF